MLAEQNFTKALQPLPMPVTFLRAAWFFDNAVLDVASARGSGLIQSYLQPADKHYHHCGGTGDCVTRQ